jgi:putative integral membrane protein (TIGR02587 family)
MVLISYQMTRWHAIVLALTSLIMMHAFVYAVEFKGQAAIPAGTPLWSVFLRFTVVGYAIALLMSLYVLWTFNQLQGMSMERVIMTVIVLGFPAAVGAAAARLIL